MNSYCVFCRYFDKNSEIDRSEPRGLGKFPTSADEAAWLIATTLGKKVLSLLKQFDVGLADDDPQNYYMGREWRMFGDFDLKDPLKEIVVGQGYGEELKKKFPEYSEILVDIPS